MKLKVTREPALINPRIQIMTTPCPFGEEGKVGSIACHECEHCKSWTQDYVFCKRGDKPRKRKQEAEE